MKKNLITQIRWISAVSRRFARVDRKGRSAVTSRLATLGICFGVMTLTVVMSIMNGFQMSFIDAILEVSSYHLRAVDVPEHLEKNLISVCAEDKHVAACVPFYESQVLMTGEKGGAVAVNVRAADEAIYYEDEGFRKQLKMLSGAFDFSDSDSIILGSSLARNLGVRVGSNVNLLVMSGGSDVELFSSDRIFTVRGIFTTGYAEINNSYAFVGTEAAKKYFGSSAKKIWGIKLHKYDGDLRAISSLKKELPQINFLSWRNFNRTFFGALRIEKNMLLLLVALIFVVVAINIYNGMRRLVFERRTEIAVLSALGARKSGIKAIFIMRGFIMGTLGALVGVLLGLLISLNTDVVFTAAAKLMYAIQYLVTAITDRQNLQYVQVNSSYNLYATIPARVFPGEVTAIALFGILSPLIASLAASKNVLKMTVSEVLHNE
ncbi:lipoprotein-releasing system permease protein [Treponema bryantii]|uniref:Lipoprotein-releasing system permease protein n=1 Tax=Treponema bryantii TaxID=163 RepID=A0A1H9AAL0_9SPIR|nr:FtsX-like permease family protein [Treponema bryantii]SEP73714.1 lipoprotein-releasing system permease protein [Treponema bryantii]